jgi:cathepsin A (carboxypeptidase C)
VGDPCTDNDAQRDSMDMLWYGHKYGFVPDEQFHFLWNNCSARAPNQLSTGSWSGASPGYKGFKLDTSAMSPDCKTAHRLFLTQTSRGFSQEWKLAWLNDLTLYGPSAIVGWDAPGSLNYMTAAYMNRQDVRTALNLGESPQQNWPGPDVGWKYTSDYAACNDDAAPGVPSMIDFYQYLAPKLRTTVVYNGDTDPCVSYEGTRTAIERVGFKEVAGGYYRPWFYNQTVAALSTLQQKPLLFGPDLSLQAGHSQYGGSVVDYEHNLSFITVHGSGHMVPQFRPQAALRMLDNVLTGRRFTPLGSPRPQLDQMTDAEFHAYLDTWTEGALAYV